MTAALEFWKNAVEEFEFPTRAPQEIIADTVWVHCVLDFFKDEGVITNLLQLHHRVVQPAESLAIKLAIFE